MQCTRSRGAVSCKFAVAARLFTILDFCCRRGEAAEMYDVGIARKARPIARLEARKRDFSRRMLHAAATPQPQQAQQTPAKPVLTERPVKSSASSSRSQNGFPLPPANGRAATTSSANARSSQFQVYTEGDEERAGSTPWIDLESRDAHRKENVKAAVPAQGEVLKQRITVPMTPKLDVFVDEVRAMSLCSTHSLTESTGRRCEQDTSQECSARRPHPLSQERSYRTQA